MTLKNLVNIVNIVYTKNNNQIKILNIKLYLEMERLSSIK